MKTGVVIPQNEVGEDPGAVRAFAQAAEDLGYEYLIYYDHVLGADTRVRTAWEGPYSWADPFHEPFVAFGYLAALTKTIELVTAVMILPQRQTALVAKQAAEVDLLSGGRLRLGIGVGWNDVEYTALGENFHNRGRRSEEQVELLRALWTNESVDFHGAWHDVPAVGIRPLPIQRPIPIWFGGGKTEAVLRRIARLGDGWMPQLAPDEEGREAVGKFQDLVVEAGRAPGAVGIDARVGMRDGFEVALERYAAWQEIGATHVAFNSLRGGISGVDDHIDAMMRFKEALT